MQKIHYQAKLILFQFISYPFPNYEVNTSAIKGAQSSLVPRVHELESRAVYTYCYGHSINLVVNDALKSSKLLKDALDMTHEVTELMNSPSMAPLEDGWYGEHFKCLTPFYFKNRVTHLQ